jgi:hypothetical protein
MPDGGLIEMAPAAGSARDFYARLAPSQAFAAIMAAKRYLSLPADWMIGGADVVQSTAEIARGRYKAVNTVGRRYSP